MSASSDGPPGGSDAEYYPSALPPRFLDDEIARVQVYLNLLQCAKATYNSYRCVYGGGKIEIVTGRPLVQEVKEYRRAFLENLPEISMDFIKEEGDDRLTPNSMSPEPVGSALPDAGDGGPPAKFLPLWCGADDGGADFSGLALAASSLMSLSNASSELVHHRDGSGTTPQLGSVPAFLSPMNMLSPSLTTADTEPVFPKHTREAPINALGPIGMTSFDDAPNLQRGPPVSNESDYAREFGLNFVDAPPPKLFPDHDPLEGLPYDETDEEMDEAPRVITVKNEGVDAQAKPVSTYTLRPSDLDSSLDLTASHHPSPSDASEMRTPVTPAARRTGSVINASGIITPPDGTTLKAESKPERRLPDFKKRKKNPWEVSATSRRSVADTENDTGNPKDNDAAKEREKQSKANLSNMDKKLTALKARQRNSEVLKGQMFINFLCEGLQAVRVRTEVAPSRRVRNNDCGSDKVRPKRLSRPWAERTGFDVKRIAQHTEVVEINYRCAICTEVNGHRTHECTKLKINYDIINLNKQGAEPAKPIHLVRPTKAET